MARDRNVPNKGDVQTFNGSEWVPLSFTAALLLAVAVRVLDSVFAILDDADGTKSLAFQVGSQATGQTTTIDVGAQTGSRTFTHPVTAGNDTYAVLGTAQTLSALQTMSAGATVSGGDVTLSGTASLFRQVLFAPTDTGAVNSIPLQITSTPNPAGSSAAIFAAINAQVASNASCAQNLTSTSPAGLVSGTFTVNHFGSGTLSQGTALRGVANLRSGGGNTTGLAAINGVIGNLGANTVTLASTFRAEIATNTGGGAITRVISYQSDRQTVGGTANVCLSWGSTVITGSWFAYNNSVDNNYFGSGASLINTTTDDTIHKLQVAGKARATGFNPGVTATATAAGTTTLTVASNEVQTFTGSTTQTINFPAANAAGAGFALLFCINNQSSGTVTPTRAGSDTFQGGGTTDPVLAGAKQWYASDGVSVWLKV